MEIKKKASANLESMRPRFFITGFAIACASLLVAFEWVTVGEINTDVVGEVVDFTPEELDIPIVVIEREKPKLPEIEQPQKSSADFSKPADVIEITNNQTQQTDVLPDIPDLDPVPVFQDSIVEPVVDLVYDWVQDRPLFGGASTEEESFVEIRKFLGKHVKYPQYAKENRIQGTVWVEFVVGKDGSVRDITILREVEAAAELLQNDHDIKSNIWSATSINELVREAQSVERWNMMHADQEQRVPYVTGLLASAKGPVIAATDYIQAYADQIRRFVPQSYKVLGTDGYGRSDTREKLRHFFEVDRYYIVIATLKALADEGSIKPKEVVDAMKKYGKSDDKKDPWTC